MVELLDEGTDLTGTGAESERPAALVPEDPGKLGGLTDGGVVVVLGTVRAAAVNHEAGRRRLDASEGGARVVGGGLEFHGRTMGPVRRCVKVARNSRKSRNLRIMRSGQP